MRALAAIRRFGKVGVMKIPFQVAAGFALAVSIVCCLGYKVSRSLSTNAPTETAAEARSAWQHEQTADAFTQIGRAQQAEAANYKAQREAGADAKFRSSPQGRELAQMEAQDQTAPNEQPARTQPSM